MQDEMRLPMPAEHFLLPPEHDHWSELPDVIPDWVLEDAFHGKLREPLGCDCGCTCTPAQVESARSSGAAGPDGGPVGWAIPGVTGQSAPTPVLPPVSEVVAEVQALLDRLAQIDPTTLDGPQALADGTAMLEVEQHLRRLNLSRVGDVAARGLSELTGFRSTKAWLRHHRPDGDVTDAALASRLRDHPLLRQAVQDGTVPLASARKVILALRKVNPHLDRRDGLIDGQPADQVLAAVVGHVVALICRNLLGLADTDPGLTALIDRGRQILTLSSQQRIVEAAFSWLATELPARQLAGPLDELVTALLPTILDRRDDHGHRRRDLSLTRLGDGTGWHVCGDLTLECGERLWVALRAEAARDPHNSDDTAAWAAARAAEAADSPPDSPPGSPPGSPPDSPPGSPAGSLADNPPDAQASSASDAPPGPPAQQQPQDLWGLGADLAGSSHTDALPRDRRQRLHDALNRLLGRYLEVGLGGTSGKVPVQIHVTLTDPTLTDPTLTGSPGAAPPRTDSGRLVPRSLVRRWWCDATVTNYVLSLGGKALRVIHSQRTLTADERRALTLEGGDRCAGDGCCPGTPDPLVPIRPHHVLGYAEDRITSLDDTLPVCDTLHHDLHEGHRTVRLRNGRYLNEHGYVDSPPNPWDEPPPF